MKKNMVEVNSRRIISRLVKRVIKNNRMLFVALGITYALAFSLLVLSVFFYPSIKGTYNQFITEYKIPQATVLMEVITKEEANDILESEETQAYSLKFAAEGQTYFDNEKIISCQFLNVSPDDNKRYYDIREKKDAKVNDNSVMVSAYFADHNGVKVGDKITVKNAGEKYKLTVTNIVSIPEILMNNRDATSWYDSNDFAHVFLSDALMDEIFDCADLCNRVDIWFNDGRDAQSVLDSVKEQLGEKVTLAEKYEGSESEKNVNNTWDGTRATVTYLPVFIIIISVLSSTLFFIQIVNREDKTNGIMMTIGYDIKRLSTIFLRCALLVTAIASVLGLLLGAVMLRTILNLYVGTYYFPYIKYCGNLLIIPVIVVVIIGISVVSSVLACLSLRRMDPAMVFSGNGMNAWKDLPRWISRLKTGMFIKLSICAIYRNRKRFILAILCSVACLILTFTSLSVVVSKNESLRYIFEDRYKYDLAICCTNEEAIEEIAGLDGIGKTEKIIEETYKYHDETVAVTALPVDSDMIKIMSVDGNALKVPEDGIILEEGYARRHGLSEGDIYIIEGKILKITGISREYFNSVQYISFETATRLGKDMPNVILIKTNGYRSNKDIISEASEIEGYRYYYDTQSRKANCKSVLSSLDVPSYVIAFLGLIIGALIISTMNIVTIFQNRRKYAVLHLIGASTSEFLSMAMLEAILQFVLTIVLSFAPAYYLTKWLFLQICIPSQEFVLVKPGITFLISSVIVALYLMIGIVVTIANIRKIKYIEVLSEK